MPSSTEAHLEAAISELGEALRSPDCGVCAEYVTALRGEAEILLDLMQKARILTERQMEKRRELTEMEANASRITGLPALGSEEKGRAGMRPGFLGNGGLGLRDMFRNRPRITDFIGRPEWRGRSGV